MALLTGWYAVAELGIPGIRSARWRHQKTPRNAHLRNGLDGDYFLGLAGGCCYADTLKKIAGPPVLCFL